MTAKNDSMVQLVVSEDAQCTCGDEAADSEADICSLLNRLSLVPSQRQVLLEEWTADETSEKRVFRAPLELLKYSDMLSAMFARMSIVQSYHK